MSQGLPLSACRTQCAEPRFQAGKQGAHEATKGTKV